MKYAGTFVTPGTLLRVTRTRRRCSSEIGETHLLILPTIHVYHPSVKCASVIRSKYTLMRSVIREVVRVRMYTRTYVRVCALASPRGRISRYARTRRVWMSGRDGTEPRAIRRNIYPRRETASARAMMHRRPRVVSPGSAYKIFMREVLSAESRRREKRTSSMKVSLGTRSPLSLTLLLSLRFPFLRPCLLAASTRLVASAKRIFPVYSRERLSDTSSLS